MHTIATLGKKISLYIAVFMLSGWISLLGIGAVASADDIPCVAPADSTYGAGVHHPTGADAIAYTYNCTTDTWNSQYYTFYPISNATVPNYPANYGFNCATNTWYKDYYGFSAADNSYHYNRIATSDPGLDTGCPPAPAATQPPSTGDTTVPSAAVTSTGPSSTNGTSNVISVNGTANNTTNLGMNNIIVGNATTGNTFVVGNTTGGSAGSGNAQTVANVANLLQSTTNAFGPGVATFTANINGDVTGDFMFDPSALLTQTGPNSTNTANNGVVVNTNDTNNTNAQITNAIDVGAASGNATVASNTTAGDATSGNAQAVVNLMNLINSTVASGQSFVGTININGNLNGDILLPQGLIDQLLAATGPNSSNTATNSLANTSTTTNNVNQNIANVIQSSALTGNADVSGNTSAGSATSGTAHTGVTLLNLTGSNTIGKNNILVFVNVLGTWVGMIMNAPSGTNAASLGGGISQTGPNSSNTSNNAVTTASNTTNNVNQGITNNVNVHAQTGDATVTNNTSGGNAKSGNASTAVNILNLNGVNISLSDWFGVLFINVFGMWNGSFGVNTAAGNPAANPSNNPVQAANQEAMIQSFRQFATFAPSTGGSGAPMTNASSTETSAVLGSSTAVSKKIAGTVAPTLSKEGAFSLNALFLPALGVLAAATLLAISERGRLFGKKN